MTRFENIVMFLGGVLIAGVAVLIVAPTWIAPVVVGMLAATLAWIITEGWRWR